MDDLTLVADKLRKTFNRRTIFADVSFTLGKGEALAFIGRNGSGKSTLLKIVAGVLSPTSGAVHLTIDGQAIEAGVLFNQLGFVAPYLQLYDEFTGYENLDIFRRVRGYRAPDDDLHALLDRVNLSKRKNDDVRTYSSGMKQRLKYAFALLHRPPVLLLDEPRSNLDSEGIATINAIIDEQLKAGSLIIATNDNDDLRYCRNRIDLDSSGGKKGG